ncbi:MAG: TadE family protein [Acidimicrobiales bacterium]
MHRLRASSRRGAEPTHWLERLRRRSQDERGVAVLEAAIITPIFFTLILGVAEIGLAMNDYLALAATVRAGARVASASGNDGYADYGILSAVERESAAIERKKIQYIVVYKPSTFGEKPSATCQAGTPVANVCNVYTVSDFSRPKSDFGCRNDLNLDRYWCPNARNVTITGTGTDYVGVWMKVKHPWLTKMFGADKMLTDQSVIRLEPRQR